MLLEAELVSAHTLYLIHIYLIPHTSYLIPGMSPHTWSDVLLEAELVGAQTRAAARRAAVGHCTPWELRTFEPSDEDDVREGRGCDMMRIRYGYNTGADKIRISCVLVVKWL